MKKITLILTLLLSILFIPAAWADTFVVKKIEVQGLERITPDTVYTYIPIKTGQTLNTDDTSYIIAGLYKTGFFDRITLSREGNTLIVHVTERSTIGQIKLSGNSSIPTDKLIGVMKSLDIAEGRVYNQVVLERIKQSLLNQYYQVGRYNARVDVNVTPMTRNRVLVTIQISEGLIAKVRRINIIGNHAFTEKELDKQLELTTPGLFTFFTQTDRYSQEKLDSSIEKLKNFYLDHGYIKVAVKSSQVAITPDRKSIYLTIVIDEGEQYTVSGYTVNGDTIIPREEVIKLMPIKPGSIFSRQTIVDSEKAVTDALGNKGYMFAAVSVEPKINEANKSVFLTFTVKPGKRVYVRNIYFSDNTKTNDVVLRREVVQMEGAPVSTTKIEDSKHRLSMLPYIKNVDMSVVPVPDQDDRTDVNYKVTEDNAAQATFSVGYSQLDHLILGVGLNQKNFLGTGKTLGFNFTHSRYQQFYGINYTDPYYTADGISRSINLSASKLDPRAANLSRSYSNDYYNASVIYGIPIGQEQDVINRLQLGYGYEETLLKLSNGTVSNQVQSFVNNHGRHFQEINLIGGLTRDSRDKAIFPTTGMLQTFAGNLYVPVNSQSIKFYTLDYDAHWYHPIVGNFIATARGEVGYGNAFSGPTNFPFFKNFYAGGFNSVRGFAGNTLGPLDSNGDPTGGNLLADASIGVIFPNHISDNLRTTFFVDGGNVYNTFNNRQYNGKATGPARYTFGVEADWLTPLGLIDVSLAKPFNAQPGDQTKWWDFSLGANFG